MTDDTKTNLYVVDGDGGNADLSKEELQKLKDEAQSIAKAAAWNVNERRIVAEETRYCLWEGQSRDGRKHAEANDGKPAFPYEGASDIRLRLADMIVNERVLILSAAAFRNLPRVKGLELHNEPLGQKLTTLLRWVIKNKLGGQYFREIVKLAQYQEADSPAGAIAGVCWDQEVALELRTLTLEEIVQTLVQTYGLDATHFANLDAQLMNPDKDAETAQALQQLVPHLSDRRAKDVVKQLREDGHAEFPAPYLKVNQPAFAAYRLFEDVFFPTNTADLKKARAIYIREWLSEVDLRQRIVSHDYDPDFVDKVLEHESETGFPLYRRNPGLGEFTIVAEEQTASKEARRGLYEVITCLFRAVNADSIPGIYYVCYSHFVDFAAHERRLLDYQHGDYPYTYFCREILGARLLDSRGVPELASTEQQALKLLGDSFQDHVQLATLPNIKVPRRRTKLQLVIGPLKVIKEDRPGDVTFMEPPTYPQGNERQQEEVRRRVDEYWGRISNTVPPILTQLHQSGMVMNFLTNLTDALTQVLQLCQQYLGDEDLSMITGDDGIPIARTREEIQGKFTVELTFDPRDLDMEYLKTICEIIIKILQIDTLQTVQRDKLVQRLFMAVNPMLAEGTIRPVEAANAAEEKDEEDNFAKISAGVEPQMVENGQNFTLRLQTLLGIPQKNPEAFKKLTPMSREIYIARVKYLQNQVQQIKNAQIGRQVGEPALEQPESMMGVSMMG